MLAGRRRPLVAVNPEPAWSITDREPPTARQLPDSEGIAVNSDASNPVIPVDTAPANPGGRPSDPSPATRNLLRLVQAAGELSARLAVEYADHLRELPGESAMVADLRALCGLAADRHPAGYALVRSLLATAPAGHRLLAAVRQFRSTRRLRDSLADAPPSSWLVRCDTLASGARGDELAIALRGRCDAVLSHLVRGSKLGPEDRADLAAILSLEADARDERVRDLAARLVERGVEEVQDRLERVARLDAGLGDLRDLIARLGSDGGRAEIVAPHNRFVRALGSEGRRRLESALAAAGDLDRVALVWQGIAAPVPVLPDPESAWVRLQELAALPDADVLLPAAPDPLGLAALVIARGEGCAVRLPLSARAAELLAGPDAPRLPTGVSADGDVLAITCDDAFRARAPRPRPTAAGPAVSEEKAKDQSRAAIKRLVLTNLQSTSVTIAFLRDPKVYSIPGLVEEVVNRIRNPQIIEIIATQRPLHSGFANRGVPLALLKSPVNTSVKILRRFIHVKYISKIDMKRLANDRTGIRKEVGKEIERYLTSLA